MGQVGQLVRYVEKQLLAEAKGRDEPPPRVELLLRGWPVPSAEHSLHFLHQ